MKGRSARWWVWAALLVLTVVVIRWVDSGEAPPARDAALSEAVAEPARVAAEAGRPAPVVSELDLGRLRREPYPALKSNPFKGEIEFEPMVSPEAREGGGGFAARSASGSPSLPPVPYTYMGKMLEDGETVVFLTRGDRNYVVRKGATLDGQYRVDAIEPRTMVLTYLPAKAKQSLAIGSAP